MTRRSAVWLFTVALLVTSGVSSAQVASTMDIDIGGGGGGDTGGNYCIGGDACSDVNGCQGTTYCATLYSTAMCQTGGSRSCDGYGVQPGSAVPCGKTVYTCRSPTQKTAESCGNEADEDWDNTQDEADACSGFGTFDYCQDGLRWRCSCDGRDVGYCLNSNETSASCSGAGCLRKPPQAAAGGNFQCCPVSIPGDSTCSSASMQGKPVSGAFQCGSGQGLAFECNPLRAEEQDENLCWSACVMPQAAISSSTGTPARKGSYLQPLASDRCTQAQGGYTVTTSKEPGTVEAAWLPGRMIPASPGGFDPRAVIGAIGDFLGGLFGGGTSVDGGRSLAPSRDQVGGGGGEAGTPGHGGGRSTARPVSAPNDNDCRPPPEADTGGTGLSGSKAMGLVGAVDTVTLATRHTETDLSLDTLYGGFNLVRQYTSDDALWTYHQLLGVPSGPYIPKPFGSSPTNIASARWWPSTYSFVYPKGWNPGVSTWVVRDSDGGVYDFEACSNGTQSCWARLREASQYSSVALRWEGTSSSSGKFIFYKGQVRHDYATLWSTPNYPGPGVVRTSRFFLTRVYDTLRATDGSQRVRLELQYAAPAGLDCPGLSAAGNGAPYLSTVTTEGGQQLRFNYISVATKSVNRPADVPRECVWSTVSLVSRPAGGTPTAETYVTYNWQVISNPYDTHAELQRVTLLGGRSVSYLLGPSTAPSFTVNNGEGDVYTHTYSTTTGGVAGASLEGSTTSAMSFPSDCEREASLMSLGSTSSCTKPTLVINAWRGSGTGSGATNLVELYLTLANSSRTPWGTRRARIEEKCNDRAGAACDALPTVGTTTLWGGDQDRNEAGPLYVRGGENWRGLVTAFAGTRAASSTVADGNLLLPMERLEWSASGGGLAAPRPLGTTSRAFASPVRASEPYASVVREESSRPSNLVAGKSVVTKTYYDNTTNQISKTLVTGTTREFNAGSGVWEEKEKTLGTFYFTQYQCASLGTLTGNVEVVETHGPCEANTSLTGCAGTSFPITRYYRYAGTGTDNDGRLQKVVTLTRHTGPASCERDASVASLTTTFGNYDVRGNPASVTGPDGATTSFTYDKTGRVLTSTTSGITTSYRYDGPFLASACTTGQGCVVTSHREEPGTARDNPRHPEVQWVAKSSDVWGRDWTEKAQYEYYPDGTVKRVAYYDRESGLRRAQTFAHEAHGRTTLVGVGGKSGGGQYQHALAYTPGGSLLAQGAAYNEPPVFCRVALNDSTLSKLCTQLGYDAQDRLTYVDSFPKTGASDVADRTLFEYDEHDHVKSVQPGCKKDEVCPQPKHRYVYDDFGRLIEVQTAAASGPTRYGYNALGAVTVKQTAAMAAYMSGSTAAPERVEYVYDAVGRLRRAQRVAQGGATVKLYELAYGDDLNDGVLDARPPSDCEQGLNAAGRLAYRKDSFGHTWYMYDALGRLTREMRVRSDTSQPFSCAVGGDHNPDTRYTYGANGLVATLRYPHGREVEYLYGAAGSGREARVTQVNVTTYDGTQWTKRALLVNVTWEPFGGLRSYRTWNAGLAAGSAVASKDILVEYALGGVSSEAPVPSDVCSGSNSMLGQDAAYDQSGLLRLMRVTSGDQSETATRSQVYNRAYTWKADQVTRIDTCALGETTPRTELYGYDATLRLTSATRPAGNFDATGGAFTSRTYGHDGRGRRIAQVDDGREWIFTYPNSSNPDLLSRQTVRDAEADFTWMTDYDQDGRAVVHGSAASGSRYTFAYGGTQAQGAAETDLLSPATDTVIRALCERGMCHNYFYDAAGRRRYKAYSSGGSSEFFYAGSQLLSERSTNTLSAPTAANGGYHVEDDYVWLGGRPVAIVRGKLGLSLNRLADSETACSSLVDTGTCGVYFAVTDHIGKPVLMLDAQGRVAGEADYDPYGNVNQVDLYKATAHPYADNLGPGVLGYLVASIRHPNASSQMKVDVRVVLEGFYVDTATQDAMHLKAPDGTVLSGPHRGFGYTWLTKWVPAANGVDVTLTTDATGTKRGFAVRGYRYRRYQTGAQPFWTNMRFPGQYFDPESELFENWNRYYEPRSGMYLQSEPAMLSRATTLPVYGYALWNPLAFVDGNGLVPYRPIYSTAKDAMIAGFNDMRTNNAIAMSQGELHFSVAYMQSQGKYYYTPPQEFPGGSKCGGGPISPFGGMSAACHNHVTPECNGGVSPDDIASSKANPDITFYMINSQGQVFVMKAGGPTVDFERIDWEALPSPNADYWPMDVFAPAP